MRRFQKLDLDTVIAADGTWSLEDDDALHQCVEGGRWTPDEGRVSRAIGDRLAPEVIAPTRMGFN